MSTPRAYKIPMSEAEAEIEVKKSRFIASLCPITSEAEAKAFIERQRNRFPGANHHCWAFVVAEPFALKGLGSSDDGEPSGTAGRPMLAVLTGAELGQACVVVTRFFGGTKLGTGGLVRAYSQAVRAVLEQTPQVLREPQAYYRLTYPYSLTAAVEATLNGFETNVQDHQFTEQVQLSLSLPLEQESAFVSALSEQLHGQARVERLDGAD
ncbi:YigZ family protein [Marinobacterium sediminicola]|uniref:YigZ family protein n=1 Tax=Marinobacterium sediminicola TaxID=518898 RepID=UPI001EEFBA8C|nr:YigZ family protein [Marinobacterium sediminicola]ULG69807.1 YigZ family protein [Marinobacterium sediminicola]